MQISVDNQMATRQGKLLEFWQHGSEIISYFHESPMILLSQSHTNAFKHENSQKEVIIAIQII